MPRCATSIAGWRPQSRLAAVTSSDAVICRCPVCDTQAMQFLFICRQYIGRYSHLSLYQNLRATLYNCHARDLPALHVGSQVALQNPDTGTWDRCGVITDVGPHRRYYVRLPSGRVLTRNRRHLRQRYAHAQPDTADAAQTGEPQTGEPHTDDTPDGSITLPAPPLFQHTPEPPPPSPSPPPPARPVAGPRRSERPRCRPARYIASF